MDLCVHYLQASLSRGIFSSADTLIVNETATIPFDMEWSSNSTLIVVDDVEVFIQEKKFAHQ